MARLRRCDEMTMYFEGWDGKSIDQVYVAGISMRNHFSKVDLSQSHGEKIITLFREARTAKPGMTLNLSADGTVLTLLSPPFRSHTYLRCLETRPK